LLDRQQSVYILFSFSSILTRRVFNRKRRASERLSVRGGEISNTVSMHPLQELELRVNALDEAIETEVGSTDLVGYQALNKVLGGRTPTFLLHRGRSFGNIPGRFGCAHTGTHFFRYQGCLRGCQKSRNRRRPEDIGGGRNAVSWRYISRC